MRQINVVVVPVSLMPYDSTQLRVVTHKPNGQWLQSPVPASHSSAKVAREVLGALPVSEHEVASGLAEPEAAGFVETGNALQLVYTAALPLSAYLLAQTANKPVRDEDWPLLAPWLGKEVGVTEARQRLTDLDDIHRLVLGHWRRSIEETTAAFDLLPEHFTTSQVRAVYSSVWGAPQDAGNFHRWLHRQNSRACVEVAGESVQREVKGALQRRIEGSALQREGLDVGAMVGDRLIGTAPAALGASVGVALASVAPLVVASAIVGGLVAYQRRAAPGKPPQWYTPAHKGRHALDESYSPRPAWLLPSLPGPHEPTLR